MQVNVALNEDLTCTYKMSEMSSCSVEGILQVLIKSNFTTQAPFYLMIRDPSHHVQTIVEDRKCVENLSKDLQYDASESRPDYKFSVSVPKLDEYVPVLKYKCSSELRPVPMRVQTRVRRENQYWRVAVQISSNPHNEDNLTNLTIIMGVPPAVNGESMVTYPDGGKWNVSKRSVIWCVSELSRGEKFQLQARFEADPSVNGSDEQPKFPVLVRCECMYSQLSDIEVEVTDVPDVFATDMKMKLARRFRLSHRERP
uniref:MHD domain-containing protein n=1 Tax=Craspedostauros australis TaxID=1486917 RepID=A0A7R9ZQQ0_9STRA